MKKFIGFYDHTVVLTYVSLASALFGIVYALNCNFQAVLVCMGVCILCDCFDGVIARHKQGRTERESCFGVQIDSLCDMISFGILPAVFFYKLGVSRKLDLFFIIGYCLCCVIRLAYFNVLAMDQNEKKGLYHGLPVPALSMFVPLIYMFHLWLPGGIFIWLLRLSLTIFAILYILDFKVKKPKLIFISVASILFWIPTIVVFICR